MEGYKLNGMRGSLAGGDDADCLRQAVTLWLKKRGNNPTWAKLVAALRHETVGDEDVVDDLIQKYLGKVHGTCACALELSDCSVSQSKNFKQTF